MILAIGCPPRLGLKINLTSGWGCLSLDPVRARVRGALDHGQAVEDRDQMGDQPDVSNDRDPVRLGGELSGHFEVATAAGDPLEPASPFEPYRLGIEPQRRPTVRPGGARGENSFVGPR